MCHCNEDDHPYHGEYEIARLGFRGAIREIVRKRGDQSLMDERKSRGVFLLLLAIGISALFFRMIQSFVLALLLAAVLAGLSYPMYERILRLLGGRKGFAAAATMLLGLVLIVGPVMAVMTIVAREATQISTSVGPWIDQQRQQRDALGQRLESIPWVAKLAPYEDKILANASELGGNAASFAVTGLAAGTRGTAKFFLSLFVMSYAVFFFLQEGRSTLDRALRHVPLSGEEKNRMLNTFTNVARASLKGTGVIGIVQGALGGAAFALAGITGPVFWGMLMAVLSIVPGIGPAVIWVPGVVYLAVEGRTGAAIALGLWCVLVVSTVDNLLRPRLVGKDTQMPDLLILLGTLGGLAMFGVVGIIVGPIIAALFLTVWELFGSVVDRIRDTSEREA